MPRKDGTGPQCAGAKTGRKMGNCQASGADVGGNGFGRRAGSGCKKVNCGFNQTEVKEILTAQKSRLEERLAQINQQLSQ